MDVLTIQLGWVGGNVSGGVPPSTDPGVIYRDIDWMLAEAYARARASRVADEEAALLLSIAELLDD